MEKYLPAHRDEFLKSRTCQMLQQCSCHYCYSYINDNIDGNLSVGDLAAKMCVSKSTLNRKLSMFTGRSANEIIRDCRLKKAAELHLLRVKMFARPPICRV